jgi:hypothetical protein
MEVSLKCFLATAHKVEVGTPKWDPIYLILWAMKSYNLSFATPSYVCMIFPGRSQPKYGGYGEIRLALLLGMFWFSDNSIP